MTRLIDADALNKKLCETTIFIKDGEAFQRMINNAPTIEPTGDLISRQGAINAIENTDCELTTNDWNELTRALKSLPSAETPTVSEKHQLSEETPTNTPTDLISKAKVLEAYADLYALDERLLNFREELDEVYDNINALPSAPDSRQSGEWLWDSGDGEYFCSECRTAQGNSTTEIISGEWNFCPNCGADMRKGDKNE